jgi:hypothetical protein
MKKRCLLPLFISAVLALGTSVPVFAQTLTLDTNGSDGYAGDVLMTLNTRMKFDFLSNYKGDQDKDFNENWDATTQSTDAESDGLPTDQSALSLKSAGILRAQDSALETPKEGSTKTIYSTSYYNNSSFTAKCVAVTAHCTIWYDVTPNAPSHYTEKEIADLAPTIEEHAVTMLNTFGDSKRIDVDNDGRVAFVFYPFNDNERKTGGFFSSSNLSDNTTSNPEGNHMDMLNINAYGLSPADGKTPFKTEDLLSICCHEWQHLINESQTLGGTYGVTDLESQYNTRSYFWLNETFAESSMAVNGLGNIANPLKIPNYNEYLKSNNNSLTVPFAFQGLFIPRTGNVLSKGIYINWLMFGRYLSAQTEGYTGSPLTAHTVGYTGNGKIGGGDAVYQSIFNSKIDPQVTDVDGHNYSNVGYCNYDALEKALTDMGYLGDGPNAKAKDLNEMLRNFVIATTYRQTSGVYTLGGIGKIDLSTIQAAKLDTVAETPQKLPGAYTAAFTKIDNGSITTGASGADIQHVGIKVNYDGVQADGYSPVSGAMLVNKGTQVTLSTTDTNTTIRYSTDGTDPTATTGTVYTGPITIDANTTIKAVDTDQWGTSSVNTFYYTIGRSASATTVTIDGVKGRPISPQTLTIFLTGDQFKNLKVGDDVTFLFPNLTPGLKATVSRLYNRTDVVAKFFNPTVQAAESTETYDTMDVTISGTPTVTGEVDLTLSIPAQYLASGIAFTDVALGTAKIDVTETAAGTNAATGIQSDSTTIYMAMGLIVAAAALIIIAVPRKRKS